MTNGHNEDLDKWLERQIFHYVSLRERHGGAPLSFLIKALTPDEDTPRTRQIREERPEWLAFGAKERVRLVKIMINAMLMEGRLKTTEDDAILYLNKMLTNKHTPEPHYLPVNVLDQMVERMESDVRPE